MSARENLNGRQFFHGTTQRGLAEVTPGLPGHGASEPGYAYATTNEQAARHYAHLMAQAQGLKAKHERVYAVEPTGPVEDDPHQYFAGMDKRSTAPWRVIGELPR